MGLVDYSDSDSEGGQPTPTVKPQPPSSRSKPAFSKVVDRSNPGKIKVSLPQTGAKEAIRGDEPPSKRAKTSGGGAFGGFNSFLPAPKRPAQTASTTILGGADSKKIEPVARFSFKTGAAPAFERGGGDEEAYGAGQDTNADEQFKEPVEEVKLVGKPLMFRPLSVSRKPTKKKSAVASAVLAAKTQIPAEAPPTTPQPVQKAPRPKISLFSMIAESDSFSSTSSTSKEYHPMMYEGDTQETDEDHNQESQEFQASYEDFTPNASQNALPAVPTPPVSQSLDDIAGDLNLSAAERRQLFGRQKSGRGASGKSAMNVINFNMDKEYLHNEELRAAGEQVALNPVRAIAPGKHSLKQLVNAAVQQKDALEESFAKGKSNRQEASSRYGW